MSELPGGTAFGSLVHAVLETTDPFASDLAGALEARVREHSVWWPVDVPAAELAAALVPMHDTPLGSLAGGLTLRQIGLADRLRELDFEIPLAGGDLGAARGRASLFDVGRLVGEHLGPDDPLAQYADRLRSAALDARRSAGYLSGSIDAVLRIPDGDGHRYLVVDYKTNRLGDPDRVLTAVDYLRPRMVSAMLHSDYPLQALLYSVVLHRFLRWRVADYDPGRHLGGVLYLFVRGMCGPETPVVDGHPAGVFSWRPPIELVAGSRTCSPRKGRRRDGDVDAVGARGLLQVFNEAGVLDAADVHVADRLDRVGRGERRTVALALALAVRALRRGSVCVDLSTVAG